MASKTSTGARFLTLLVSSSLALLAAWAVWRSRRPEPTVKIEDMSAEVAEMLERRRAERPEHHEQDPAPSAGTWPRALVREPLEREIAAKFFPALENAAEYDPFVYVRRKSNIDHKMKFAEHPEGGWRVRTNSEGLREDEEIRTEQPDVRILVTGDSHTDGLCPNSQSFANVLESLLAADRPDQVVEVLNCGTGAYHFYNYLGVLERFRELKPDVFIVAVYGGNDFYKNLGLLRYFERLPPSVLGPIRLRDLVQEKVDTNGAIPQELGQVVHFLNNPDDVALAIDNACSLTLAMHVLAQEIGTELIFVYLPPPFVGQPRFFGEEMERMLGAMDLEPDVVKLSDEVADGWLRFVEERGIRCLDLRPIFQQAQEVKYWYSDHHLNIAGHSDVAHLLKPLVEPLL